MRSPNHFLPRACLAAACLSLFAAVAAAQGPQNERVFSGKLGNKYRIQMRLRRVGGNLAGSYFYERVRQDLALRGEIDGHGNFTLREYDAGGAQTGVFKGQWRPSDCEGCGDFLTGKWSKPDGKGALDFGLTVYAVAFRGPLRLMTRSISEQNRKGQPQYEISVEYPQLEGASGAGIARFNEMISAQVKKDIAGYREDFRGGSNGSEFNLSYEVGLANDDLVSVDLVYYFYYGGAGQRNAVSVTTNYDLTRGRTIKFEELFRPSSNYEKVVSDYCLRDLKNQYKGEEWATDERLQFSVEHVVGDENKWMITPEGLALIFDSAEIGPPGAGHATVVVPYGALRRVIRPDGLLAAFVRYE
ncbi:MAG TPA: DUF3298 and DUF4163 domain-containing protein [Pyrinomonadaceae bacterium]|nr:DUF3298 and DUF4163 domain-containing protein [Pyrinomonadaceae bacterium]